MKEGIGGGRRRREKMGEGDRRRSRVREKGEESVAMLLE